MRQQLWRIPMKTKHFFSGLLAAVMAALAFLVASPMAYAAPVRITLNGVVFDDGGTIVDGSSFILDIAAQTVTDVDISTSVGLGPPWITTQGIFATATSGFIYSAANSCFSQATCVSSVLGDVTLGFTDLLLSQVLDLNFDVAADGSLTLIGVGDEFPGGGGYRGAGTQAHTAFAQNASLGTITVTPLSTIPEPGTFALVGLALAVIGLSRRKDTSRPPSP